MLADTKDLPKLQAQMKAKVVTVVKDNEENESDARKTASGSPISRRERTDDVADDSKVYNPMMHAKNSEVIHTLSFPRGKELPAPSEFTDVDADEFLTLGV